VLVEKVWNHSDGNYLSAFVDNLADVVVLDADHVLAVDLQKVVIDEEPVSGGGRADGDGRDAAVLELEAQVATRVLVQRQRTFKRSIKF